MKLRIERERTDYGYGLNWVVMDADGEVLLSTRTWYFALWYACSMIRAGVLEA